MRTEKNILFKLSPMLSMPSAFPKLFKDFVEWKKASSRKTIPTPPISSVMLRYIRSDFGKASLLGMKLKPVVVNPEMLSK